MTNIILASQSPRRRFLLKQIGVEFTTAASDIKESHEITESADHTAIENAYKKAKDVSQREKGIIIGADTVVVLENTILGKPKDKEEARATIKMLSGKTNTVITGIAMINTEKGKCIKDSVSTDVKFRELDEKEISIYIDTADYMDAAGSYKIQEHAAALIENVDGCYSNIVGFPVKKIKEMLKEIQ